MSERSLVLGRSDAARSRQVGFALTWRSLVLCGAAIVVGCGVESETASGGGVGGGAEGTTGPNVAEPSARSDGDAPAASTTKELNFLFVHGVEGADDKRARAEQALEDLEGYLLAEAPQRTKAYEQRHPNEHVTVSTRRVNLYTDRGGKLLRPSIDDPTDGTGAPVADRWREQLATKIALAYPNGERNIVLVGHSTGAKVAMEVAADVRGAGGPRSGAWGVSDRIAGVVTMHGILAALQDSTYNVIGPLDYARTCNIIQTKGWCEYSAFISAFAAADWVATNKRALMLTSWAECSPSSWTGQNDKMVPLRAQGSPKAFGITMTPGPGETYLPAHGLLYGHFCHGDLVDRDSPRHAAANAAAGQHILDWVFDSAPRVVASNVDPIAIPPLRSGVASELVSREASCPAGEIALPVEVQGTCVHPGHFDGNDHAFDDASRVDIERAAACGASLRWSQHHEGEEHAARVWFKTYSAPAGGGLLGTLPSR